MEDEELGDALLLVGADALYYDAALTLGALRQQGALQQYLTALGAAVFANRKSGGCQGVGAGAGGGCGCVWRGAPVIGKMVGAQTARNVPVLCLFCPTTVPRHLAATLMMPRRRQDEAL